MAVDALNAELTGIGRYTLELVRGVSASGVIDDVRYINNGRWVTRPESLLRPPKTRLMRKIRRWAARKATAAQCKNAVFHGPNFFVPEQAQLAVATIHDLSVFRYPETHPAARLRQYERDFDQSLRRTQHIITPSDAVRQEVIEAFHWPEDRITSVHHGVSPAFRPRSAEEIREPLARHGLAPGGYCLCVSTLEPRKRIDRLLEAYAALPRPLQSRYPLALVGAKGWLNDQIHARIQQHQQEGWLRYLGFATEADLQSLYAGARGFIYPSSYEGFGMPVTEAMACGVPVVTSNQSCLPEITRGFGLAVDPDDVGGLSAAIERAIQDDAWREQARIGGLTVAKGYDWKRSVEKTLQVYAQVWSEA